MKRRLFQGILTAIILIFSLQAFSQTINRSLLEKFRQEQVKAEEEKKKVEEEEMKPEVEVPETLSSIEKMFKNRYFRTRERARLESLRDSLTRVVRRESLQIELRGRFIERDSLYYMHRNELKKIESSLDSLAVNIKQFGYNIFKTTLPEISPFMPVTDDYVLGPGDELIIEISGQINNEWTKTIGRSGYIVLEKVGKVELWGKTFAEGKEAIKKAIEEEFSNIEISVSIGDLRSVNVFVLGEVKTPGIYTATVLSNPLSVLFEAGGPKKSGSLRRIKYLPDSGERKTYDLYDLLVEGNRMPKMSLSSGDIIYVPPIGDVVGVRGAVKRTGIYEIREGEDLNDVLEMAGGFLPVAEKTRMLVERVSEGERRTIIELNEESERELHRKASQQRLMSGDLVSISESPALRHNFVEIKGNVRKPGTYGIPDGGLTLRELIRNAGGLKEGTYMKRGELLRYRGVKNPEIIEFSPEKLMEGLQTENYTLEQWDKVRIFSIDAVSEKDSVVITGEVLNPGSYPLHPEMTVKDLVFAGNPKRSALDEAELFRIDPNKGISVLEINLEDSTDLIRYLKPEDYLLVKRKPDYRKTGVVYMKGEFTYPGAYRIETGEPLKEVVERAGGFTDEAYLQGAKFTRVSVSRLQNQAMQDLVQETRMRLLSEQRNIMEGDVPAEEQATQMEYLNTQMRQLESLSEIQNPGRVVINLREEGQLNMPMENGDTLRVPKLPKTVQVVGQVYNPIGITYREGLTRTNYLEMAGGAKPSADEDKIYVRRASGEVVKDPEKIKPGDTIVVPEKVEIGKSIWEIMSQAATILYQVGVAVAAIYPLITDN